MAIYDVSGNVLTSAYDIGGNALTSAYDVNGNLIFAGNVQLKIMTYNVGGWYIGSGANVPSASDADYYALQNGIIGSQDADILCIEEYWTTFSQAGRTALSLLEQYYPYIHTESGNTRYWGHAVCSKYPIASYINNYYSSETNRYYDRAVITVGDINLNVIVTHLGLTEALRQQQSLELFNYVQNYSNVILCGDFNIPVTSSTDSEYVNCYQQFVDDGYNLGNCGSHGFIETCQDPSTLEWSCIDNIITSSNIAIDSVMADQTKINDDIDERIDHLPFIAEITI